MDSDLSDLSSSSVDQSRVPKDLQFVPVSVLWAWLWCNYQADSSRSSPVRSVNVVAAFFDSNPTLPRNLHAERVTNAIVTQMVPLLFGTVFLRPINDERVRRRHARAVPPLPGHLSARLSQQIRNELHWRHRRTTDAHRSSSSSSPSLVLPPLLPADTQRQSSVLFRLQPPVAVQRLTVDPATVDRPPLERQCTPLPPLSSGWGAASAQPPVWAAAALAGGTGDGGEVPRLHTLLPPLPPLLQAGAGGAADRRPVGDQRPAPARTPAPIRLLPFSLSSSASPGCRGCLRTAVVESSAAPVRAPPLRTRLFAVDSLLRAPSLHAESSDLRPSAAEGK